MTLRRFKVLLYAQQFIAECMPIYPLYALMFAERTGLSTAQISILFLFWTAVALLAEVPTGIIADTFSRKKAIMYCYALQAVAFTVWLLAPNFAGYAIGFLLWGIGYAFASGAYEAYLFEELREQGYKKEFNKVFARSQSFEFLGMVVAYVFAAAVGVHNYSLVLWVSIVLSIAATLLVTRFPYASKKHQTNSSAAGYMHMLVKAGQEARRSNKVFANVVAIGVLMGVVGTVEEYVPLFYQHVGFATSVIPVLLAIGLGLSIAVSWFAHHLERTTFTKMSLLAVAAGCLLFAVTFGDKWTALFGMLAFMRLVILAETLFSASLQHTLQDERRATVSSIASFGGEVVAISLLACLGVISHLSGDSAMYRAAGLITIILGIAVLLVGRWKKVRTAILSDDKPIIVSGRLP